MRPPSKHKLLENEVKHLQELALENEIGAYEMDEYGHFIEYIEQPTPMPEGDLQMLRLGVSRRNKEDEVLWAIEDLIGESQSWPKWIRGIDLFEINKQKYFSQNSLRYHSIYGL